MKKIICILMYLVISVATFCNDKNFIDIESIISKPREIVLKQLGENYTIVQLGAEDSYEGYYYKEFGITFIFDNENKYIDSIECDKKFSILKAKSGMNFKDIIAYLGDNKIQNTYVDFLDKKYYWLKYKYKNYYCIFESENHDGKNSKLTIYPLNTLPEMYN